MTFFMWGLSLPDYIDMDLAGVGSGQVPFQVLSEEEERNESMSTPPKSVRWTAWPGLAWPGLAMPGTGSFV